MKLHIFGASGTGVTTLGKALSAALGRPYFDSDDYFWEATKPAFTVRRAEEERDALLARDLEPESDWILGGSMHSWGGHWTRQAELVVFLWLPPDLRLARLRQREQARYGSQLTTDAACAARSAIFLAWAAGYDTGASGGSRTLANHTRWLSEFASPVLELRGDLSTAARVMRVRAALG